MLLARMLLAALLVLHPFTGVSHARQSLPAFSGDPCGAVCCCGDPGVCACSANAPSDDPAPEPATAPLRVEIVPPSKVEEADRSPAPDAPLRVQAPIWRPATTIGALASCRLLCVWRT